MFNCKMLEMFIFSFSASILWYRLPVTPWEFSVLSCHGHSSLNVSLGFICVDYLMHPVNIIKDNSYFRHCG